MRITLVAVAFAFLHLTATNIALPAQAPAQQPPAKTPPKIPGTAPLPAAPVSKHYPILVIAHGNEPVWSLRLGMKGPERLDRANYPPIVLDPGETSADDPGKAWTYHAKDEATGADVRVKLFREACSDALAEIKYTFRVVVDHAQIGTLNGCGQSMPEQFPEFRKKNQINPDDNPDANDKDKDKDKDKKAVLEPITNFKPPVAIAYLDAAGRVILGRGAIKRRVAASGTEMSLSHDGKKLLYTRSDSKSGPERTIVLYDWDSGRAKELVHGNVRQAFWSPNDSRIAFLNFQDQKWQVWTFPAGAPEKAAVFYPENVPALHGWVGATTVLATDLQNAYWISEDRPAQTIPLKEIYGETFQVMSSDMLRVHPFNSDLLLISAYYTNAPAGTPVDSMGLNASFFLYEIRAKRRVVLCPMDTWGRSADWSRDGLQVFFTRLVPPQAFQNGRIFWDGTGARRYEGVSDLTVGQ